MRALSSVEERLPYKEKVGGSSPSAPTDQANSGMPPGQMAAGASGDCGIPSRAAHEVGALFRIRP
jgi:hypothetical protein